MSIAGFSHRFARKKAAAPIETTAFVNPLNKAAQDQ